MSRGRSGRALVGLVTVGMLSALSAQPALATCSTNQASFTSTGSEQCYIVPSDVTSVTTGDRPLADLGFRRRLWC